MLSKVGHGNFFGNSKQTKVKKKCAAGEENKSNDMEYLNNRIKQMRMADVFGDR